MRAVLSGGGTAGHVNPALALAEELRSRGWEVEYAGTPTGIESRLAPEAGLSYRAFEAKGFNRSHPLTLPKALVTLQKSTGAAKKWFAENPPDVVVGFGGYVCIPVGRAAEQLGIPVVVHEQNSVMGMANKYLAKRAATACLTYEYAAKDVAEGTSVVVTGNPVRRGVFDATREEGRAELGISDDALVLVVTGGSLGARHINEAMIALKERLLAMDNLVVIHITGPKELDAVTNAMGLTEGEQERYRLLGYTNQMGLIMAAADAIVSRAGATSLAEISARALPALLVPYPYATEDHQTVNAQQWVESGTAFMVADDRIESDEFATKLFRMLEDASLRDSMRGAALAQETSNAASALADVVEAAAKRGQ